MKKENIKIFKKNIKTKGFTLVELIIVITILAILATVAMVSMGDYITDARDSNRISQLKEIQKGLSLYNTTVGSYPQPEGTVYSGSINGQVLTYVGEFRENNARLIRFGDIPKDPLNGSYYIYGTNADNTFNIKK